MKSSFISLNKQVYIIRKNIIRLLYPNRILRLQILKSLLKCLAAKITGNRQKNENDEYSQNCTRATRKKVE